MESVPSQNAPVAELRRGWVCLQTGRFFDAHEHWEIPWKQMRGHIRSFWQAMIQLSVGAYHYRKENLTGCRNLWRKALLRCESILAQDLARDRHCVVALRSVLEQCLEKVDLGENPLPDIQLFATHTVTEAWFHFQ